MAKILWISDAGSSTGFGRATHAIAERLMTQHGHEVHVIATNYKGDPYPSLADRSPLALYVPNVHVANDVYGRSRFLTLTDEIKPDAIIFLNDPQVIESHLFLNQYDQDRALVRSGIPIIAYIPIDGVDYPKRYEMLGQATNRVAMSKHGQTVMPEAKLAYHGVDTDLFWPVSSQRPITLSNGDVLKTKAECKEAVGLPKDMFIVGRVDANTGRKDYPALWKALQPVMKKHTDVVAYFHTKARSMRSGVDIQAMITREPDTQPRFMYPGQYDPMHGYPPAELNAVYNALDLFVSTSRGEGFGMTIAEAMACGIPVIAQDFSAIPEIVGPGGELIKPERAITVPFGQDQMLADIGAFSEAIEHAYNSRGWRRDKGRAGRKHVTQSFVWDESAASFHVYISALTEGGSEVEVHGQSGAGKVPGEGSEASRLSDLHGVDGGPEVDGPE